MRVLILLLMLLLPGLSQAQPGDDLFAPRGATQTDFLPVEKAFRFTWERLDDGQVQLRWQIAPGYYLYQKRLNERLALPFSRYFYYKKGTPADVEWKRKAKNRKTAARDIGVYSGYGDEAWNDEVLIGDQTAAVEAQREALIRDAEGKEILGAEPVGDKEANKEQVSGDAKVGEGVRKDLELKIERPMPRTTEADNKNDTLSLNRKLDQTLYLIVKNKDGRWRFPEDRLFSREDLHQVRYCP